MNLQVAKRLQQTEEYYFSKKLREIDEMNRAGAKVINLGIGSPDLPPHPSVIEALTENAHRPDTHAYQGYKGIPALRQAMAGWYQRYYSVSLDPEKEVLPLIGSKEGIMHICMTYLQEGDEALVPNPGYPTYRSAVNLSGATVRDYDLEEKNGWLPDLDALAKTDLSKVKLMWVNYPHMPTGARFNTAFAEKLIRFANDHNILICHDNPYSFILNAQPQSLLQTPGAKDVVLELNSLSKSSNMAGWRVGMLVGKQEWINEVLRFKSNMDSGMFQPLQMAAVKALELGPEWYAELNQIYTGRRKKVFELLELLNCTFDRDQVGLFVWAKIPAGAKDGFTVTDEILQKAQVFITPGGIFGSNGNGYIRVSLCKDEKVFDEVLQRIRAIK
ncbi:pyridoxal phosphate-dependent aminotransferase [Chitinophaga sancti]|uniref:Aminotransferase n=1 Tax=Chitinophaga sancti TaxID=1004 RepID=A0A1K1PTR4_9BACT|nr:aminotransferase class I/II-fold pyridoxal phosphate-dependent enzyme [Chitinophaga sancti]WQD61637.1 aminotransferase class I/II-fold pyridoxal phosphate-dependent enzyme [Chitinophaga sancti]WQG92806.1 aminotransferase class I/II-fold pyridoxal phosphate-dependent enzyme [Chitinophaga sancti]SFW51080.1 Aspartate/methionine/tyrosine aminotransferase [Chitinophaga sancti]